MSMDGICHPNSAFSPFKNIVFHPDVGFDMDTYQRLKNNFASPPPSYNFSSPCKEPWPGTYNKKEEYFSPSPEPLNTYDFLADGHEEKRVIVIDEQARRAHETSIMQQTLNQRLYSGNHVRNLFTTENTASSLACNDHAQIPTSTSSLPFVIQPPFSQNVNRRKVHYRQRHHPQIKSDSQNVAGELKNKTRFSATGASGKSAVVRDMKIPLASSPPSPTVGAVGGSILSTPNDFQPISYSNPFLPTYACPGQGYRPFVVPEAKRDSPTLSSGYSSLSSSSSFGTMSRKRQADEDDLMSLYVSQRSNNSVGSTSDVTLGVDKVKLYDQLSTGSLSPTDSITFLHDASDVYSQPQKRSKNDYDDDVVFVSMQPGSSVSGNNSNLETFPRPKGKFSKSTKRTSKKRTARPGESSHNNVVFAVPSTSNPVQTAIQSQSSFVVSSSSISGIPSFSTNVADPSASKRYFLRSSAKKEESSTTASKDLSSDHISALSRSSAAGYQTRSKRKQKGARVIVESVPSTSAAVAPPAVPQSPPTPTPGIASPVAMNHNSSQPIVNKSPPALSSTPIPPNHFGDKYVVKKVIGIGGGGIVYGATEVVDNIEVAIKVVPKEKIKRWGKLNGKRVPIEFELLDMALKRGNSGIIRYFEWFERNTSFVLVMERPQPVVDLFDYLNQHGAMSENLTKRVFRKIVKAVYRCHMNGVVHRDIKDENVLLNLHTMNVKIIDFGCGTFLKDEPYTEFAGTPEFYPPEWFTQRKYYGRRVDAWSLGVLLYTMVEAEVPFTKDTDTVRCQLVFKRALKNTSHLCRQLITSMLQKNQEARPTLQEVLDHPWFHTNTAPASTS